MFFFEGTRKPNFTDIQSIDYDRYWSERGFHLNKNLKERERIIRDIIPSGTRVIDIGCGNSLLPVALKEKGVDISVADISGIVLEEYGRHGIDGVKIDLERIRAHKVAGPYDFIIISEVLEHTKNPEEIIQTLKTLTERFALTVPNSAFYRYRFHLMFSGRFFTQWVYHPSEHIRFWSHIDFMDWLSSLGLVVEKTVASNGFSLFGLLPGLKNIWKNMFGHQIVYVCCVKESGYKII